MTVTRRRRRAAWVLVPTAALLLVASGSLAGKLTGTCTLRASGKSAAPGTVVWLEQVPPKVEERIVRGPVRWFWQKKLPPAPLPELALRAGRFRPDHTVSVVGGPIVVRNADKMWHGVFSVTPGGAFDLGKLAPGRVDTLRFTSARNITVRCDIHPDESAAIQIVPNHAFMIADSLGRWKLPTDLPPGDYTLRAWRPGARTLKQPIVMPKRGDLDLTLHW
jgi:hypothetical protein